jgi:hypothetical protein
MTDFDIAQDGEHLAFSALDPEGDSHLWMASLDRRTPPKRLTLSVARQPCFGPGGEVYFLLLEGHQEFLYSLAPNQIAPRKTSHEPSDGFVGISPHGDWWLLGYETTAETAAFTARPTTGGPPVRICSFCSVGWGPGGKFLYVRFRKPGQIAGGKTIVIGLPAGKELPMLPPAGLQSAEDVKGLNVVAEIDMTGKSDFAPGTDPSVYAYSRMTVQRNLFRIPLK